MNSTSKQTVISSPQKLHKIISQVLSQKLKYLNSPDSLSKQPSYYLPSDITNELNQTNLHQYFLHLEDYLSPIMITSQKKYSKLLEGLYILVKGKLSYMYSSKQPYYDKKYQFLNVSRCKRSTFIETHCENKMLSLQNYNIIIEQPFTIIQCVFENCVILEDSILIKIQQQIRKATKFDELYKERLSLIEHCHINGQPFSKGTLFTVHPKLHSSFKKYKYIFHNSIKLQSMAIIEDGTIRPIKSELPTGIKLLCYDMQQYAILLPGVKYEVVSTTAKIMTIQDNQTLSYIHCDLISASEGVRKQKQEIANKFNISDDSTHKYYNINKSSKKSTSSPPLHTTVSDLTKNLKKWQIKKRYKQFTNFTKKYSNQIIISMETCKQNLSFTQKKAQLLKSRKTKNNQSTQSTPTKPKAKIQLELSKSSSFHKNCNIYKSLANKTHLTSFPKSQPLLKKRKLRTTLDEIQLQNIYRIDHQPLLVNQNSYRMKKKKCYHTVKFQSNHCDENEGMGLYVRGFAESTWNFNKKYGKNNQFQT